nr:AAC(3) family N-acetyltransferase [Victivallales bacterium]
DRPFIAFSISYRNGELLRQAARSGSVLAHVESDGKRSSGKLPAVTALIPGRQKKELWIISHLFEPLSNDNSCGVVGSIEGARAIKKLSDEGIIPPMEFSLRLLFSAEMYGFVAYAESIGREARRRVIGALNTDGAYLMKSGLRVTLAPPATPFFGNSLIENFATECMEKGTYKIEPIIKEGSYADDLCLSDPTNAIPTAWTFSLSDYWHNSVQTMDLIEPSALIKMPALSSTCAASIVCAEESEMQEYMDIAVALAKKNLQDEALRIKEAVSQSKIRFSVPLKTEIMERMSYRFKIDSERIGDFRKIRNSVIIKDAIKNVEEEKNRLILELQNLYCDKKLKTVKNEDEIWFEYASSIISRRVGRGIPFDQVKIPKNKRFSFANGMNRESFMRIMANMDGKKNLQCLIREAEWETNIPFTEANVKKTVNVISALTDYGYLKTKFEKRIKKDQIVAALKRAGVKQGDLLFIHSSLSSFGLIEGGENTVIDALLQSVGRNGTILFPAFTRPYIYLGGALNKNGNYRPYDPANPNLVITGSIPKNVLLRKGMIRSAHPTHSCVGIGPLAKICLSEHEENDPPTCRRSPLGKILDFKGKILLFGCGLGVTTFLHFLEDEMDLPYLGDAVCRIKDGNNLKTILIRKHLPGHRDFGAFLEKLSKRGLQINETKLNFGNIKLMDAGQLYKLGIAAIKANPNVLLCDNPDCRFCSKFTRKTK